MTIVRYRANGPRRTPTPNRYREPFKPSPAEALKQRELARRYARVIAPDPYIVALLRASNAPITHVSEPAPVPTPAAPIRSAEGPVRVGDVWAGSVGNHYRITRVGSGGAPPHAAIVVRKGSASNEVGDAIAINAPDGNWTLVSRLTPAPKPAWRECDTFEAAADAAGLVDEPLWTTLAVYKRHPATRKLIAQSTDGVWQACGRIFGANWRGALAHCLGEPTP